MPMSNSTVGVPEYLGHLHGADRDGIGSHLWWRLSVETKYCLFSPATKGSAHVSWHVCLQVSDPQVHVQLFEMGN